MVSKRVVVVGGVAGGASCAARLRRLDEDAEIFMFERGPDISFANCGMPYYVGGVIPHRQQLLLASPERFRDWFNVEVRTRHEVRAIDRVNRVVEVVSTQTGQLTQRLYDYLVLALGAAPMRPPFPGFDLPNVFTLRNLEDVDRIRAKIDQIESAHVVVIGGGFIGLEMSENFVRRGMEVTLLEMSGQVMPPMDPEMTTPALEELRRHGVNMQLMHKVSRIENGPEDRLMVVTDQERFPADLVILAMGVQPDARLARDAGLKIGSTGGIWVDDRMRTSDPHIFAVGDAVEVRDFVTGQPTLIPLAGPANRQGRIVADVIAGRDSSYRGSQGTAVVGVFDVTLAMTGANEKTLCRLAIPYEKTYTHLFHHASYYPGAEVMSMKLLFSPDDGRLLGAQAVGRAGVEKRIDVISMLIQKQGTVHDLEEAELSYAPQYGSAKDPANMAGFVAGNILSGDVDVVHWSEWKCLSAKGGEALPLVLDVRTPTEAAAVSVPGAINIPLGELRRRLNELPRDREIWVHCGVGQRAYYAARILRQRGFRVRNLSGGLKSYQAST